MWCLKCPASKLSPPSESSKLPTPTSATKNTCKGCGYEFGASNTLSKKKVWRCKACNDFLVCSNCKLCKNGHHLFKCYSLLAKGMGGYKSNSYGCDFCSTSNKIKEDSPLCNFVWHCNSCEYDVCPSHFLETTLLLEQDAIRTSQTVVAQTAKPGPKVSQSRASRTQPADITAQAMPFQPAYVDMQTEEITDEQFGGFFD